MKGVVQELRDLVEGPPLTEEEHELVLEWMAEYGVVSLEDLLTCDLSEEKKSFLGAIKQKWKTQKAKRAYRTRQKKGESGREERRQQIAQALHRGEKKRLEKKTGKPATAGEVQHNVSRRRITGKVDRLQKEYDAKTKTAAVDAARAARAAETRRSGEATSADRPSKIKKVLVRKNMKPARERFRAQPGQTRSRSSVATAPPQTPALKGRVRKHLPPRWGKAGVKVFGVGQQSKRETLEGRYHNLKEQIDSLRKQVVG